MTNSLNQSKPKTYGTSADVMITHGLGDCKYILHEVAMTDTLMKLAIKYNVTVNS